MSWSDDFWSGSVYLEGCLAGVEVPLFGRDLVECATLEDDVLFCPVLYQMCSCSCLSRCSCIIPVFLYVMCCDVLVWHMCLSLKLCAFYYV